MRRSEFIRKWLGNKEKSYTEQFRDEMFEDLDAVIATAVKNLHLHDVNGSAFVIMYQKKPLKNILFLSCDEARNYIKMQHPKRTFKEPKENVFVCSRYGTTFEIVELHYR